MIRYTAKVNGTYNGYILAMAYTAYAEYKSLLYSSTYEIVVPLPSFAIVQNRKCPRKIVDLRETK